MIKHKKGVETLIAYVLLISLAIAMSALVYAWMKFYVQKPFAEESCPDITLVIETYSCQDKILTLAVQNRGRFDADGYVMRINNGTADYPLTPTDAPPNLIYVAAPLPAGSSSADIKTFDYSAFNKIEVIELEPIKGLAENKIPILCENSIVRQNAGCS